MRSDASAPVSLLMPGRHTEAARRFFRSERPSVGVGGSASAVARRVRMARTTAAQGGRLQNAHDAWVAADAEPIEVDPADVRVASVLVRRFEPGSRAPDALHVAVRHRLDLPFLTSDEPQAAAAERLGVRPSPIGPVRA